MNRLRTWIKQNPIAAFYLITYAITWGLGFSFIAVIQREIMYLVPLVSIALCGPALAAIFVTAGGRRTRKSGINKKRWTAFFVALILSTAVFLANNVLLNHAPFSPGMAALALFLFAPPVAYVISAAYSGNTAVRRAFSSLVDWRRAGIWAFVALLFVPCLALLSVLISDLSGRGPANPAGDYVLGAPLLVLISVKFIYQIFFFNATGEEMGWSGFARPRLQAHLSPLLTALVVSLFWAPWHFFLWHAEGQDVLTAAYWSESFIFIIPAAIIIGWLYNRSGGSILVAGIAHAAGNTVFYFLPNLDWIIYTITAVAAALLLILVDRMWRKLPQDHRAVARPGRDDLGKAEGPQDGLVPGEA